MTAYRGGQACNSVVGDLRGRGYGGQASQSVPKLTEEERKLILARKLAVNSPREIPVVRLQIENTIMLRIVDAIGLDEKAIELLTNHLQSIKLPEGCSGDLVFELRVKKRRVRQVVWDEEASSLKEQSTIELIRRKLFTWLPPRTITGTILIQIRIQA
ncbi:after-VIT domain-containing protein [Floridanema evergladense]|uniref:After-VIT domain-containing protein n=1 Tax=Floridaenema evergladense BLCC-F167 TaxID=3153639 RepID=A0ABV4WIJ0_9CYAN